MLKYVTLKCYIYSFFGHFFLWNVLYTPQQFVAVRVSEPSKLDFFPMGSLFGEGGKKTSRLTIFFPSFVFLSSINIFRIVSTGNCLCQVNNYSQIFPVPLSPFSNSKRPPVFTLGSSCQLIPFKIFCSPSSVRQSEECFTNVMTICGCLHDVVNEIQCLAFHNRIRGYLSRVTYSIVS